MKCLMSKVFLVFLVSPTMLKLNIRPWSEPLCPPHQHKVTLTHNRSKRAVSITQIYTPSSYRSLCVCFKQTWTWQHSALTAQQVLKRHLRWQQGSSEGKWTRGSQQEFVVKMLESISQCIVGILRDAELEVHCSGVYIRTHKQAHTHYWSVYWPTLSNGQQWDTNKTKAHSNVCRVWKTQ